MNEPMPAPAVLSVRSLAKRFVVESDWLGRPLRQAHAVAGVSLDIAPREVLGLVGESGCGKTTLSRMLVKLIEPSDGTIHLDGEDVTNLPERQFRPLRRKIQMVFQDPYASLDPRMTVSRILAEGLLNFGIAQSMAQAREIGVQTLKKVGLRPDQMDRLPHEFSGGQRQRIGIARAIAVQPSLVVCDEPVSALDVSVQAQVINLLMSLRESSAMSYLFIAHDLAVVRHISDRVIVMYMGRVVEQASTAELFRRPAHPYTRTLLASTPQPERGQRRRSIPVMGEVASPLAPPRGCSFHPRCPHAVARCMSETPELRWTGAHHQVACHFDLN